MKRVFTIVVVFALAFGVIGCETVKGMGRDIEKAGDAIEKAAD